MTRLRWIVPFLGLLLLASGTVAQEPTPTPLPRPDWMPDPAAYRWELVVDDFDNPLGVYHAGDGSGRLFLMEQGGFIWVVQPDGSVNFDPFLDFSLRIPQTVFNGGYSEQGLLSMAFAPDFPSSGHLYIHYINRDGDTTISRLRLSASNSETADPASEEILLTVEQPYADHNGGQIAFGPDGYLYVGLGDGGSLEDPLRMAQRPATRLGKILRLDVSGAEAVAPPDNPFVDVPDYLPEIWALGVRNPWRFSFDRLTGDLFIGDVGQAQREEINISPAGQGGMNFGWSVYEGTLPLHADQEQPVDESTLTMPTIEYPHTEGCSVTGGFVYRGAALPELEGMYLFGDYCTGRMWLMHQTAAGTWEYALWMHGDYVISSFGEDEAGELLLVDYKGSVYRLIAA
jgi:glucose/arabinose dehydrogenase